MIGAIEFARPGALVLLVLPLVVLWFARRAAARPTVDATGTLEIWQRSVPEAPRSASKPRIPLAVWVLAIALVFGALALVGPRSSELSATRRVLVVVDRSPSMYLRDGAGTRLEHALGLARERIAALGYERVAWIAPPIADDETRAPAEMPPEWLVAPRWDVRELDFTAFDRADVIFVTDRAPETKLERAGVCCSGGAAVPGPIGVDGGRALEWDGASLTAGRLAAQGSVFVANNLPEAVRRMVEIWMQARGLTFEHLDFGMSPGDEAVLCMYGFHGSGGTHAVRVERDGWSAEAQATGPLPVRDGHGALTPWLTTTAGEVVVAAAAGRVHVALHELGEPRGDPAAWAVSWSQLFDEALALPRGCVSLAERREAGAAETRDPFGAGAAGVESSGPWTAIAAGIAALLALVAAWIGLSSARERSLAVP